MLYLFIILNALAISSVIYHRKAIRDYYWPDVFWITAILGGFIFVLIKSSDRRFSTEEVAGCLMIVTAVNAYVCGRIVGRRRPLTKDGRVDWDKITSQRD